MRQGRDQRLSDTVRTLRWIIIVGIFAVVIGFLWVQESWLSLDSKGRIGYGILLYGCAGSLVTWLALSWVSKRIEEGEAAAARADEEQRYISSIAASSADAILSLDTQHIITSWNKGAELIFGYTEQEIVGQHISRLVPDDLLQQGELEQLALRIEQNGYIRNFETERLTRDGRRIPVEVTQTALIGTDGTLTGYSKIVRDITERKQAEELQRASYEAILRAEQDIRQMNLELEERIAERTRSLQEAYRELRNANEDLRKANEQLKQLDRMKSEFVSMVSHALRAPITNIGGAIELLAQKQSATEDSDQRELLRILTTESARLTRLITGVLTVSRLEGGRLEFKMAAVDLQDIVSRMVRNLAATHEAHSFSLSCPEDLPRVWADPDYTEEVCSSLIDNAIKYSPRGGIIDVKLEPRASHVIVSVSDTGVGIAEHELENVFERFHRIDGSDSGATGGYGLGLYISKRLIEMQGGWMEARSRLGEGSTFSFALPVARSPRERKSHDRSTPESPDHRR